MVTRPRKIGDIFLLQFIPNLLPQVVLRRTSVILPIGGRRLPADEEGESGFRRNGLEFLGDVGGRKPAKTAAGNRQKDIALFEIEALIDNVINTELSGF